MIQELANVDRNGNSQQYAGWAVVTSDDTSHSLGAHLETEKTANCFFDTGFTAQTIDGSGYTVTVANGNQVQSVYDRAGNSVSFGVADSNGNSIIGTGSGFTDTLGVSPVLTVGSGSSPSYTWTDINNNSQSVTVTNTSGLTLKSAFGCGNLLFADYNQTGSSLPTNVSFPDGTAMGISYEPTPGGSSGQYTGRISQITLRTGGTIAYQYNPLSAPNDGINCDYGVPVQLKRITSDGTTTYTWAAVNNGNSHYGNTTTVVDNGGIYFQPTTLFETIVMLILLVGGLVLIARSLRPNNSKQPQ